MEPIEAFYREYADDLRRYLLSLCRDAAEAEELLAETFFQALRALPRYRGEASPYVWLCGIGRRVWLRSLRRKTALPLEEAQLALYLEESPADRAETRLLLSRMRELMAKLDDRSRVVVELRTEGYSYREIGQKCGLNESTARVLDCRARKKLRETLQKEGLL